jgi:hypothetical protein
MTLATLRNPDGTTRAGRVGALLARDDWRVTGAVEHGVRHELAVITGAPVLRANRREGDGDGVARDARRAR